MGINVLGFAVIKLNDSAEAGASIEFARIRPQGSLVNRGRR